MDAKMLTKAHTSRERCIMAEAVATISREELKEKMDRGDDFVLVETLPDAAFRRQHLPGAINLEDMDRVSTLLPDKEAEIIVYCTNFN